MMNSNDGSRWEESLLAGPFQTLLDRQPGVHFFAKDLAGRFMAGNQAFVNRCGLHDEQQLFGLTDCRVFPPNYARKYQCDDRAVIARCEPLLGVVEMIPDSLGRSAWFVTDKLPLFDREQKVCGLYGIIRSYEKEASETIWDLNRVAAHLKENCCEPLPIKHLAELTGLSVRQFERQFLRAFQVSPRSFLIRTRVEKASEWLARTDRPIQEIAREAGFYDHSDLARKFIKQTGRTPSAYRREAQAAHPLVADLIATAPTICRR